MSIITNVFKFIIGSVFGSFLSLIMIRYFRQESIVFPPSHCDSCGHRLSPWELIPVISFLMLRGKCAKCRRPIDPLIFIGETLGGILVSLHPITPLGLTESSFDLILLFIGLCDHRHYLIPSGALLLALAVAVSSDRLSISLLITTLLIYLTVTGANHYLKFIGNGDVDLIFILFLRTDLFTTLLIISLSSLLAIVKYTIHHDQKLIPYGPYLIFAYFILSKLR